MPALDRSLDNASAADLADLLLAAMLRRRSAALIVEPLGEQHVVGLADGSGERLDTRVPSALGDALVARLALLAEVDPWAVEERLGRLKVSVGATANELLLVVRESPAGLAGELRPIGLPAAHAAPPRREAGDGERIGPYRLEAELGRGGMGVVYRARHEVLGRPVAIKILHRSLAADPQLAAQFIREGRAASLANHPGIVNVTDFGTLPDGRAYLVMELVEAQTLDEAMAGQAFEPRRAVLVARRIAGALEAAHVRGVVHRDLKPSNVFIDANDEVKIADFGAAKVLSGQDASTTQAGIVVGTPSYMSPEHARGLPTDERTDIYAVGCILFKMLTGQVPYTGASLMDVLFKHVSAEPPAVRSPHGPLPPALEGLVHRAMAKRPEQRPTSAGELRAGLDAVLGLLPRGAGARP